MDPDTVANGGAIVTPLGEAVVRWIYIGAAVVVAVLTGWGVRRARRR
jgi:hypothetical protein